MSTTDHLFTLYDGLERVRDKLRPDQHQERERAGLPADLIATEQSVWRRFSPRRNPWPEVAKFDGQSAELGRQRAERHAEINYLHEQLRTAPQQDAERLAAWHLDGGSGDRPEPSEKAIREELEKRQADLEALDRAIAKVGDAKAAFVEKHRPKLVREAAEHVEQRRARYLALIDELVTERQALIDYRAAEIWAAIFPSEHTGSEFDTSLAGGRKRPLEAAGWTSTVNAALVFEALREDAAYLRLASTQQQRMAIEGRPSKRRHPLDTWDESPEGQERERQEKKEALRRYEELWGKQPA